MSTIDQTLLLPPASPAVLAATHVPRTPGTHLVTALVLDGLVTTLLRAWACRNTAGSGQGTAGQALQGDQQDEHD